MNRIGGRKPGARNLAPSTGRSRAIVAALLEGRLGPRAIARRYKVAPVEVRRLQALWVDSGRIPRPSVATRIQGTVSSPPHFQDMGRGQVVRD